ncbi:MAG TPA: hypothetical protein VGC13_18645 [Longimicrobium sp.]|jgi:hypothetical protein|uniref:hypothetical protein n=1 Tax=Longimicrobium sp. TaxID=2029185 RepID=UPI002EDB8739
MKKLIAVAALAALVAPAAAHAQAEGQINASATIAQVLAFDNTSAQAISFGTLSPDQTADVSAEGYIPLKHNVAVQIWFASLPSLQVGTAGATLTTTYQCSVAATTTAGTYGTCPTAQGDVTAASQFYQTPVGGTTTNYVHVKATLDADDVNAAAPGLYEGTIEVRAAKSTI